MSGPPTKADFEALIVALNRLALAVEHSGLGQSSQPPSLVSFPDWECVEKAQELPFQVSLDPRRIFEDGPAPFPPELLTFASSKLSSAAGNPRDRVIRAWRAGFWAWGAVATHSDYTQADPIALSDVHWIVVRATRITGPIRMRKVVDLRLILSSQSIHESAVYQGFASLTEVQVFCSSYGIDL